MARLKYDITEGRIYQGKSGHRRIVATFQHPERGTRIVYSVGGVSNRECGYPQFRRWATANDMRKVAPAKVPTYALKGARA